MAQRPQDQAYFIHRYTINLPPTELFPLSYPSHPNPLPKGPAGFDPQKSNLALLPPPTRHTLLDK